jgi:hypothetical protein
MIKSRMKQVRHVACMGDTKGAYRVLVGRPEVRDQLEDLGIDWRIILKLTLNKWDWEAWTGFSS